MADSASSVVPSSPASTPPADVVSSDFGGTVWGDAAADVLDAKVKPPGSLGRLEEFAHRLAAIQQTETPRVDRLRVCVFAGDHGVAAENVSAYPASVTAQMMQVLSDGEASIHALARSSGVEVETIDVGVDAELPEALDVVHAKVRRGTRNLRDEPAMTPSECEAAMEVGRDAVRRAAADGVQALGLGEIGIGNTTAASAVCAALTGASIETVVGRGTGVDDAGLARKRAVVRGAASHVRSDGVGDDPAALLAHLGGLEMAAITGAALEAPAHGIAVVADGFISTAAILAAVRIDPSIRPAVFFGHRSDEPGHDVVLDALDAHPILELDLRLGEGTGAALALPILRAATNVVHDVATMDSLAGAT